MNWMQFHLHVHIPLYSMYSMNPNRHLLNEIIDNIRIDKSFGYEGELLIIIHS